MTILGHIKAPRTTLNDVFQILYMVIAAMAPNRTILKDLKAYKELLESTKNKCRYTSAAFSN